MPRWIEALPGVRVVPGAPTAVRAAAWLAAAALVSGLVPHAARAAALSPLEQRVVAAVDAGVPAATELLERMVDQNSGTMNFSGVRAVADQLTPDLTALGFQVRWIDGTAWGRAGHLVATRPGRHAKLKVLLVGHLDTVFERDSPFQHWRRLDDSTVSGPGTSDMKGGDVVALLALRALAAARALDRFDVRFALMGDEERSGTPRELRNAALLEAARGCDVALGFEDGSDDPREALIARRGSYGWTLRTTGHAAHSSQIFRDSVGDGAIYEMARILAAFRDSLRGEPHLTINPGLALGGGHATPEPGGRGSATGKANIVAESTYVSGDLRALTREQFERAQATLRRIAARHLPMTDATLTFGEGYPALPSSPAHERLLATFSRASEDLGYGPVTATNPDDAGAADVSHVGEIVPMVMDGVGLSGGGGHTDRETANLRVLPRNARRVALTLLRLADAKR